MPAEIIKQDEFISSALSVDAIVGQQKMLKDVMAKVMKKDVHYGVIPGCNKPSLWKPGAELLCLTFRLSPAFESSSIVDGKHLTVTSKCTLTHIPSGKVFGAAEAMCSTKEKKYRLRKDGGKVVENGNLEDSWNTVLKMANKRALVAAMLIVTGSSDLLTQDMGEDEEPLMIVETEAEVKDIVKKADGEVSAPPDGQEGWNKAKLVDIAELTLPSGNPAWEITDSKGLQYRTSDKACRASAKEAIEEGKEILIKFKLNGKGTRVIEGLKESKA